MMDTDQDIKTKYTQRIQKSLTYIYENLEHKISLDDIANAGSFSKYHFHRIFSMVTDEPVMQYVARMRLEKAASQLIYAQHKNITTIANLCGFSSPANFSKLFKKYYGTTPSKVRKQGAVPKNKIEGLSYSATKTYSENLVASLTEKLAIIENRFPEVKVFDLPAFYAVGYMMTNGYEPTNIFYARDKIKSWIKENNKHIDCSKEYDIYYDSVRTTPEHKRRYCRIVQIKQKNIQVEKPYLLLKIPAGKYAQLTCNIHIGESASLVEEFLTLWLPTYNFEIRSYPMADFLPDDSQGHWLIPIKNFE